MVSASDHTADVEGTHTTATSRPHRALSRRSPALASAVPSTPPPYAGPLPISTETRRTPQISATSSRRCQRARRRARKQAKKGKGKKAALTCTPSHLPLSDDPTGATSANALGCVHVSENTGRTSRRRPRLRAENGLPSMSCNRSSHAVPISRNRRQEPMPHPTKRRTRTTNVMTKPKK